MAIGFRVSTAALLDGRYVVTVRGEADALIAAELEREFDTLIGGATREVIVDMIDVPFVESTTLAVLLRMARRLRADDAKLVLVTDDPRVLRTFEISGLFPQFTFERTLSSAVERTLEESLR